MHEDVNTGKPGSHIFPIVEYGLNKTYAGDIHSMQGGCLSIHLTLRPLVHPIQYECGY